MAADPLQALAPGSRVDGFVIEAVVARTAAAALYRVRDEAADGHFLLREYAPAHIARRSGDGVVEPVSEDAAAEFARGVARFLAQAARAATVHHGTLVRSIRAFRSHGTACELLAHPPGRMLSERLREGGGLTPEETAAVARGALDALEFLHGRQALHGAVDPAHVLLTDAGGVMLVAAAPVPVVRSDDPYAATEQVDAGAEGERGPWTDVYRLAATLFHCLAGTPPTPAAERREALRHGDADPLPAPNRLGGPADGHEPAVAELRTLIGRGLKLAPGERPQSLREWRARIADLGEPAEDAGATGAARRGARWIPVVSVGLVLLVLLIGGLYLLSVDTGGGREQRTAETAADRARAAVEAERWRQALATNAVVGYRKFIEDFPDSPRVDQAREYIRHLETLAWPAVLEENTRAAFEAHLETFPDGLYATEALARIEAFRQEEARQAREAEQRARRDDAAWETARAAGTVAALDVYLADWAGGRHAAEARDLRQALLADRNDTARFQEARQADSIAAYRGYMSDFPAGRHVREAMAAIDRLTLRPGKTFRDCGGCPEMAVVPAGAFWQGSADASPLAVALEKPRRRVTIDEPFAIGVREITMRQWDACVDAGGCERRPGDNGWGRGRRPVIGITWNDAQQYAEWLSATTGEPYSLPSESEWEYAARAGEESDWLGGSAAAICSYGNVAGTETGFDWRHPDCADRMAAATAMTGSFEPNAFGLYDVIGNVAEWTLDCMNLSYLEAPTDGSAWTRGLCSSRMTRGGSWFSGTRDIRLPARFNLKAGDRNDFTGFRVVRRVEPQQE